MHMTCTCHMHMHMLHMHMLHMHMHMHMQVHAHACYLLVQLYHSPLYTAVAMLCAACRVAGSLGDAVRDATMGH